jgi:hypothetical protein
LGGSLDDPEMNDSEKGGEVCQFWKSHCTIHLH